MKKSLAISVLCIQLSLLVAVSARAEIQLGCTRGSDESSRLETARALISVNATNYETLINYWSEDVIYQEPVFTNVGRQEMLDYLSGVFGGTGFGFPDDRKVTIKDEINWKHLLEQYNE